MSILEKIQVEYDDIIKQMSSPEDVEDWSTLGERKKSLDDIVEKKKRFDQLKEQVAENEDIIKKGEDSDILEIAKEETDSLVKERENLKEELKMLIGRLEEGEESGVSKGTAIVEIRAGAGGDEASLFVGNLFEMYHRLAQKKGIEVSVLDDHKTEQGGYKIITFKMKRGNPYELMRFEAGVHRVQRVPETEKAGRVHTSTVSVAVLAEPKKGKIKINPADVRLETCKSSGPGGQYVNKRETAVRIVHEPTGIVVTSQNERSLQQNKETAMSVLEAKLLEKEQQERIEKLEKERKEQIGTAMRAEKIRTYNFMQNRVTDHRVEQSWYKLEEVLGGDLEDIIDTVRDFYEQQRYSHIVIE